jgi:wobble nucleotide-excising tRNase
MLVRIEEIQGVGLLHQAIGKPYACKKATLIYADNGRGKSTLATIFRSAAIRDNSAITAWKTVDGTLPPKVVLQVGSGHKVTFENGTWSEQRPEFLVFDSDFIGRNVYSGGTVSTEQRKNLLTFALGEGAVTARKAEETATADSKAATEKVKNITNQLSGHHQGLSLAQFEHLPQVAEIDLKVTELQNRLAAASNVAAIQAKPIPQVINEPSFNIDGFFGGLAISLDHVHEGAEMLVKEHISKLGGGGAESWLNQGLRFSTGPACPYCDQDISDNQLISAYRTHFNTVYVELKNKVATLNDLITTGTAPSIIDDFIKSVGVSAAQAIAWSEQVPTLAISFDASTAKKALTSFRDFVSDLNRKKQVAPTESLGGPEDKAIVAELWDKVLIPFRSTNATIKTAAGLISNYRAQLTGDSPALLNQKMNQLQATKHRYDPTVVSLLAQLGTAQTNEKAAEKAKNLARKSLDGLMEATLNKYQTSINTHLNNFGASFRIEGMSANFKGSAPRSEYGLLLRGKDVALDSGSPPFATALSEGDKRTLAFAFFVASTLGDSKLPDRTVVIDDPICSLDRNRRQHTRTVLNKIHATAAQLIVLAHDPYFLRDLRDALHKEDNTTPIAMLKLAVATNNYTDFASLDIDKECESAYSKHHRLLNEYVSGNGGDPMLVANAIRPMLEGYLHRRFPWLLPKDLMFGGVVSLIRDASPTSPLNHAKNLVDELTEINDYAGRFHHDRTTGEDAAAIDTTELGTFAERALNVIHKGAP